MVFCWYLHILSNGKVVYLGYHLEAVAESFCLVDLTLIDLGVNDVQPWPLLCSWIYLMFSI